MVDIFYPTRPKTLAGVCLYDFIKWYVYSGTSDNSTRVYQKLQKPHLPNHKLFDPSNENQREDYYYYLLLLFIPFHDENDLIAEGETAEVAFNRHIGSNVDLSEHHEKLQALLKAQTAVKVINEARQVQDAPAPAAEEDAFFQGEAKAALEDVFLLNECTSGAETVEDRISKLNSDQLRIFNNVNDHLTHQKCHEDGTCSCTNCSPLCMFISGVGGTGKSFLIHTIRATVNDLWKDNKESVRCALAAPTGLAAFNIDGVTVHRLFQLPVEHDSKTSTYWPLPIESLKVMRNGFRNVKLIIIDEVSMLSSLTLSYIHLRLEELFGGDQWFGGMNVLLVGDILQLPPVNGSMVFQNISNRVIAARLGCMTCMAYVAMSRVRTLAGLYVLAFDSKCIKVSTECIEEVNRLRKLFKTDLPCIEVSNVRVPKSTPRCTGVLTCDNVSHPSIEAECKKLTKRRGRPPKHSMPGSAFGTGVLACDNVSHPSIEAECKKLTKRRGRPPKHSMPGSASGSIDLTLGDEVRVPRAEVQTSWPHLRYYLTDELWQREKCAQLGLQFHSANHFQHGGPNVVLNRPNLSTVLRARGDENCLFRCLSQIITGSPDQHYKVRICIIRHMRHISHLLITSDESDVGDDIEIYISDKKMDQLGSYGSNNEMLTLSILI